MEADKNTCVREQKIKIQRINHNSSRITQRPNMFEENGKIFLNNHSDYLSLYSLQLNSLQFKSIAADKVRYDP